MMHKLLVLLTCLIISTQGQQLGTEDLSGKFQGVNPAGLVTIEDQTFYISPTTTKVTVLSATQLCNDAGMKIISFETESKWLLIKNYMDANGYAGEMYWTSGQKYVGDWLWSSSGQFFTYDDWESSQPDNLSTNRICVLFDCSQGWFDDECNLLDASFVCEY